MPFRIDVTLPKTQKASFPDRCISCGQNQPGDAMKICSSSVGWLFGLPFFIDVPVCRGCRFRVRWQRWSRFFVLCALIVVAALVARHLLVGYDSMLRRILGLGIIILFAIPYVVWDTLFPACFDMTPASKVVEYHFQDLAYAREFAELNDAEVKDWNEQDDS